MSVVRCVVKGRLLGIEVRNMFTYDCVNCGVAQADCEPLAMAVINGFYEPLRPHVISTLLSIYEVEIQSFEPGVGWSRFGTVPLNWTGGHSAEIHSSMIALQVLGRTLVRRVRGLKYIPGITEAVVTNNVLLPQFVAPLAQVGLFYISDVTIGEKTFRPGVVTKDNVFVPFTASSISNVVTALNRRKS